MRTFDEQLEDDPTELDWSGAERAAAVGAPLRLRPDDAPEVPALGGDAELPPLQGPEDRRVPPPPDYAPPRLTADSLAKAFGPKAGGQSPDWADLQAKLERAFGRQADTRSRDNMYANTNVALMSRHGGGPYRPDAHAGEAEVAKAKLPLEMAQQRQSYELNEANLRKAFAPKGVDPLALREMERKEKADAEQARHQRASEEGALTKAERDLAEKKREAEERAKREAGAEQWRRMNYSQRERAIKQAEAHRDEGKPLSGSEAGEISDVDVAKNELYKLSGSFEENEMGGVGGKLGALATEALDLQDTQSAAYEADAARARQAVGKILEGGKLAAGDERKYKNMLLRAGDSPEVRQRKTEGMKAFLDDIKSGKVKILRSTGYRVPADAPAGKRPVGGPRRSKKDGKLYQVFDDDSAEEVDDG